MDVEGSNFAACGIKHTCDLLHPLIQFVCINDLAVIAVGVILVTKLGMICGLFIKISEGIDAGFGCNRHPAIPQRRFVDDNFTDGFVLTLFAGVQVHSGGQQILTVLRTDEVDRSGQLSHSLGILSHQVKLIASDGFGFCRFCKSQDIGLNGDALNGRCCLVGSAVTDKHLIGITLAVFTACEIDGCFDNGRCTHGLQSVKDLLIGDLIAGALIGSDTLRQLFLTDGVLIHHIHCRNILPVLFARRGLSGGCLFLAVIENRIGSIGSFEGSDNTQIHGRSSHGTCIHVGGLTAIPAHNRHHLCSFGGIVSGCFLIGRNNIRDGRADIRIL